MNIRIREKLNRSVKITTIVYFVFSALWIGLSGFFAVDLFFSNMALWKIEVVKGSMFVGCTSTLLYFLLQNKNHSILGLIKKLESNEQYFSETFDHSAVGILHTSADGRVLIANNKFCEMLKYDVNTLKNLKLEDIVHPSDLKESSKLDKQILTDDINSYVREKKLKSKSGEIVFTRVTKSGVRNSDGNFLYFISIVEEMTLTKAAELNEKKLLKTKERLLSEVHHRVKNNLAIISGMMELQLMNSNEPLFNFFVRQQIIRLKIMAFIYEVHYEDETLEYVDFNAFLKKFSPYINGITNEASVQVTKINGTVNLNINEAIPCGLVLSELVIHSFFRDNEISQEKIAICLNQADGKLHLKIENILDYSTKSLTHSLISVLATQLGAALEITETNSRTSVDLFFQQRLNRKGAYGTRRAYSKSLS